MFSLIKSLIYSKMVLNKDTLKRKKTQAAQAKRGRHM